MKINRDWNCTLLHANSPAIIAPGRIIKCELLLYLETVRRRLNGGAREGDGVRSVLALVIDTVILTEVNLSRRLCERF